MSSTAAAGGAKATDVFDIQWHADARKWVRPTKGQKRVPIDIVRDAQEYTRKRNNQRDPFSNMSKSLSIDLPKRAPPQLAKPESYWNASLDERVRLEDGENRFGVKDWVPAGTPVMSNGITQMVPGRTVTQPIKMSHSHQEMKPYFKARQLPPAEQLKQLTADQPMWPKINSMSGALVENAGVSSVSASGSPSRSVRSPASEPAPEIRSVLFGKGGMFLYPDLLPTILEAYTASDIESLTADEVRASCRPTVHLTASFPFSHPAPRTPRSWPACTSA
jgi:hypothetical protein